MGPDDSVQKEPSPVVYTHEMIDQGTRDGIHYVVPKGWPVVTLGPGISKEDTDGDVVRLESALKEAGIGKIVRGKMISTAPGKLELPLFVKTRKGPNVPIFLQYSPFPRDILESLRPVFTIRSAWKFRRSPFALYSHHPIDAEMVYHCSGSPESTFESEAFRVYEFERPDVKRMAKRCTQIIADHFKLFLGILERDLVHVDEITRRLHWTENTPVMVPTGFLLGTYVGEVVRSYLKGEWVRELSGLPTLVVDGEKYNPIADVMQQIKKQDGKPAVTLYEEIKANKR